MQRWTVFERVKTFNISIKHFTEIKVIIVQHAGSSVPTSIHIFLSCLSVSFSWTESSSSTFGPAGVTVSPQWTVFRWSCAKVKLDISVLQLVVIQRVRFRFWTLKSQQILWQSFNSSSDIHPSSIHGNYLHHLTWHIVRWIHKLILSQSPPIFIVMSPPKGCISISPSHPNIRMTLWHIR